MNPLTGRLIGRCHYRWAGLWTALLATSLLACGSKTSPAVKDASAGRDGALRDSADGRVDEPTLPDAAPSKGDTGADDVSAVSSDARPDISDTLPASTDIVSVQPDMAFADAGRFDSADAGTADLPSAHDGLADSLQLIDLASGDQANRDVPFVPDGNPADTRVGIDVGAVDGSTAGCNPVAPGAPISFKVPDGVSKLVSDPTACLMYGLRGALASKLVVFDTAQKKELTTVDLGGTASDFDLSPDGLLVASVTNAIKVIDKASWTVTSVATVGTPGSLVVANGGIAYYMEWSSPYDGVHRIDLNLGLPSDARLGGPFVNEGGLELSPAGDLLFMGEAASTGCNLYSVHPLVSPVTTVSKTTWDNGNGFGAPSGHVYLGPNGKHVYYADHQFDASDLGRVLGKALYVFAEDSAARFAVSEYGVLDAQLLTTLVPMPNQIEAAAFTSADTELWTYDISADQITCTNVADLAAGKKIGVREATAGAIGDYTFAILVADPIRPRLYGLDAKKQVVVSIDSQTGTPLRTVVVGSTPTKLEIDAAGAFIYTGHSDTFAVAQIDAASFTFVKFIPSPQESYEIAVLANNRIATNNLDQWTFPAIVDVASGAVLDQLYATTDPFEGALFATADGKALFIGESGGTGSNIIRYDVSGGKLTSVTSSDTPGGYGYDSPSRSVVGTPDGTSIYYAGYCLNGTNLTVQRYAQADPIVSVAPNGVIAISSTKVYRVADGTALGTLPSACPVQAVSPDSKTLYCSGSSGISTFSLAGLQ